MLDVAKLQRYEVAQLTILELGIFLCLFGHFGTSQATNISRRKTTDFQPQKSCSKLIPEEPEPRCDDDFAAFLTRIYSICHGAKCWCGGLYLGICRFQICPNDLEIRLEDYEIQHFGL